MPSLLYPCWIFALGCGTQLPGPELGNNSYMWCEKKSWITGQSSIPVPETERDWKDWRDPWGAERVTRVWMSWDFGIRISTVERNTPEGPCLWCFRQGFGHQLLWGCVCLAGSTGKLRFGVEHSVGYQEPHKRCRDVFSLTFCTCAAPVCQGGVKLKAEQHRKGLSCFSSGASVSTGRLVTTRASVQPCSRKGSGAGMDFGGFQAVPGHLVVFRLLFYHRKF